MYEWLNATLSGNKSLILKRKSNTEIVALWRRFLGLKVSLIFAASESTTKCHNNINDAHNTNLYAHTA